MNKSTDFDRAEHNRRISHMRGRNWKQNLRSAKPKPTLLAALRCEKGYSQESFLPQVDIKTQTVYAKIERGESLVEPERAMKIAKALGVKPGVIFWEPEPNKFLALPHGNA